MPVWSGTGPRVPRARRRLPASRRVRRAVSRGPPRGAPGRPPRRGDLRHVGWEAHTGAAPGIALGGVKPQHTGLTVLYNHILHAEIFTVNFQLQYLIHFHPHKVKIILRGPVNHMFVKLPMWVEVEHTYRVSQNY